MIRTKTRQVANTSTVAGASLDDALDTLSSLGSNGMPPADKAKLDGIQTGATANLPDASLLDRANHTGTQASSTIADLASVTRSTTATQLVAGANTTITRVGDTLVLASAANEANEANVKDFGAVGDGVADDTNALQLWLNAAAGKAAYLPSGSYRALLPLYGAPLKIYGDGYSSSKIIWDGGDGLTITAHQSNQTIIEDVAFLTKGVASGTAITLDYSQLISGSVIVPRAETHGKINRVRIAGATSYVTDGWSNGVVGISMLGLEVRSSRINGVYTGAYGSMPQSVSAIHFTGSGSPAQLVIDGTFASAFQNGIFTENAEGIYVTSCEFVTVGIGYKTRNIAVESGVVFSGNHIAAIESGIDIQNIADVVLSNNVIYNAGSSPGTAPATLNGVVLGSGCNRVSITNNSFSRTVSSVGFKSIVVGGAAGVWVGENTHYIGDNYAIQISSAAYRVHVSNQNYASASSTPILNESTSTTFSQFRGYIGNINDITSIYADAPSQTYILGSGCTNGPNGVATGGASIVTHVFDPNTAHQVFTPSNTTQLYWRRKTAGVWTAWSRLNGEYGSNANGNYAISPDGTLQCWASIPITAVLNTTVSADWVFPVAAANANSVVVTNVPSASLGQIFHSASSITATKAQINLRRNDSAVATPVLVFMTGRAW